LNCYLNTAPPQQDGRSFSDALIAASREGKQRGAVRAWQSIVGSVFPHPAIGRTGKRRRGDTQGAGRGVLRAVIANEITYC
jgi:hypothetical protein